MSDLSGVRLGVYLCIESSRNAPESWQCWHFFPSAVTHDWGEKHNVKLK